MSTLKIGSNVTGVIKKGVPVWSGSILLFSFFSNLLLLAPSLHLLQVYDRVLVSQSVETLVYITIITVIALIFYAIAEIFRSRLATRIANKYITDNAASTFSYLVHDRKNTLDSSKTLRELNTVQTFLGGRQYVSLHDLPFFPIFLLFLFALHPTLGVVALLGILAMLSIAVANYLSTKQARKQSQEASNSASAFSLAVLRRTDEIRAMGLLPSIMERWGTKTAESLNAKDKAASSAALFYGLSKLVRQSLQVLVMAWGANLVLDGDMSGGMIFAASLLLGKTLTPIEQIIGGWEGLMSFIASKQALSESQSQMQPESHLELPEPVGELVLENLVYRPSSDKDSKAIVNDVSLVLHPGEIMVMMGPSGAGKSTIARLIVGAVAPSSGYIRLDGFETDQWPEAQRGEAIGYVPQDIILFPGTIAENIARLATNPNEKAIVDAAQLADVHDMIASLPDGYSTVIGPNTAPLSGGQRQRIALARAYYANPKVLILDEPNSYLDIAGEKKLMQSLSAAKSRGIAVLIVSQRRSILNIADRVTVIIDGKLCSNKVKAPVVNKNENSNIIDISAEQRRAQNKQKLNVALMAQNIVRERQKTKFAEKRNGT